MNENFDSGLLKNSPGLDAIPEESLKAADRFLDSNPDKLQYLMDASNLQELAERRDELKHDARFGINDKHWGSAFTKRVMERWQEKQKGGSE